MRRSLTGWAVGGAVMLAATAAAGPTLAHHSFAVFFSAESEVVAVTGTVSDFRFANPHGLIAITAKGDGGAAVEWRIETNSPSILRRRGWTKDSLKLGETITVKGWPARDGTKYMRMRDVLRADGTPVGQALASPAAPAGAPKS